MIGIIATFTVADENAVAFEAAASALAETARAKESGARVYQLVKSLTHPTQYCMMELWADQATLDRHVTTEWYKEAGPALGPLLEGRPKLERYTTVERASASRFGSTDWAVCLHHQTLFVDPC